MKTRPLNYNPIRGHNHPNSHKLSLKKAYRIIEEYEKGDTSYSKLAKKHGISMSMIGTIITRQHYVFDQDGTRIQPKKYIRDWKAEENESLH